MADFPETVYIIRNKERDPEDPPFIGYSRRDKTIGVGKQKEVATYKLVEVKMLKGSLKIETA